MSAIVCFKKITYYLNNFSKQRQNNFITVCLNDMIFKQINIKRWI